jgi:predicted GTPase
LVNKWDLSHKEARTREYIESLGDQLKELRGISILCISAKTGYNCDKIFSLALSLEEARKKRIETARLNDFF